MQAVPNPAYVLYNEALQLTDAGYKAGKAGDAKTAHTKYEQARAKYRQILKMEDAAKPGRKSLDARSGSGVAAIWANLALLSTRENRPDAISLMKKAIALSPKTGVFWQQLGALYLQKKDWVNAQKAAQKAIAFLPQAQSDSAEATLGIALMAQNKWAEALPTLRKQKRLAGEKAPQAEMRLLYALGMAGKKTEAAALAKKLAKAYPKNVMVQQMAGDIAMQMGAQADANAAINKAYALAPADLNNGLKASVAAQSQGNYKEARKIAAKLAEDYPDDPRPHFQLGYLLFYSPDGDDVPGEPSHFVRAEKELRTAALASPKNAAYLTFLGLSLLLQGNAKMDEASGILKSALYLDKNAPMAHLGLAKIAEQKSDWDAAANHYQSVLQNDKTGEFETRTRIGLSGVLYTAGKKAEAYQQLETVADKNPADVSALAQLASWQVSDKKIKEAEATYQKIITRTKNSPAASDAHVALGQLMERDNSDGAQKEYEAALAANPQSANAALALGNVFLEKKQPQEAVKVYQTLLKNTEGGKGNPVQNNMVRWQLASVYETNLSQPNEALKEMQAMIIVPGDPNRLVYQLGPARLLIAQSRYDEAIANLSALRAENPKEVSYSYLLADALEKNKKTAEAEAVLQSMIPSVLPGKPLPPEAAAASVVARLSLAGFYERTNKLTEAGDEYEAILRNEAARSEAVLGLYRVREAEKKPESAGAFIESLVFAAPTEPNVGAVAAAQRLYQTQSGQVAGESYQKLTQKVASAYPKNRDALVVRIQVLMSGTERTAPQRTEARDLLNRLLAINPADAEANVQLGRLAEEDKQAKDAIAFYTKALVIDRQNEPAIAALRRLNAPLPPGTLPPKIAPVVSDAPPVVRPAGGMVPRAPSAPAAPPALPKGS